MLILESTHKDEFIYENERIIPIAPAQGTTGENIEQNVTCVMDKIIAKKGIGDGVYRFISEKFSDDGRIVYNTNHPSEWKFGGYNLKKLN